jgi:DNA-directed RNA polymerase specialized sigma24 family protein
MKRERDPTQSEFERLLSWLDPNPESAGAKYETIRHRLVRLFISRGCIDAEYLADEVMNRVTIRIFEIVKTYEGDPALYFYGFVKRVYLEYSRPQVPQVLPTPAPPDELEREDQCLEQCMQHLPAAERRLVLTYFQEEKGAKINCRKKLAEEFEITLNALRIRIYRICLQLEKCLNDCLEQSFAP